MGKASSNKKVARAAKAGATGGLSRRASSTSWGYYGTLVGVVGAGVLLVVTSLIGRPAASALPPGLSDHWHAAYGVYDCDRYLPPINGNAYPDVTGIHAHDDGLIHIHPFTTAVTGNRAVLGEFAKTNQMKLSGKEISYEGVKLKAGDKCKGKDGKDTTKTTVRYLSFTSADDKKPVVVTENPNDIRLREGLIIAMVRAPEGIEIPAPPSVAALASPTDLQDAPTAPGQDNSATTTPTGATTTVAGASTTVAGASTTVAGGATTVPAATTTAASATASTTGASTTGASTTGASTTGASTTGAAPTSAAASSAAPTSTSP